MKSSNTQEAYQLITPTLISRFNEVSNQSENNNPIIIAKYFNPCGAGTWYATEYNQKENICFGYVTGLGHDEWGYFSITELKSITLPFGVKIERDLYFEECHFTDLES